MAPFLKAHQLSKKYRFDEKTACHSKTFKSDLFSLFRKKSPREDFYSLKDVSFQLEQGESLGIIGSNGAGKSTLLKILSRVISPTSGWAEIAGRTGALLEVGAGFHPDLTGRENIYLSGAVLGMTRLQIAQKFDEIIAFSGIEASLDQPVKRYSSGMYLRLAFSVMIHLDTDLLLIDEALAVGDPSFQARCIEKIKTTQKQGKSILLVSHQLDWIEKLCPRTLLLHHGILDLDGPTKPTIDRYNALLSSLPAHGLR